MRKLLLYAALLLLSQCSKCKDNDPSPEEPKLPAETQSGAGTLGCKVNGKVFVTESSTKVSGAWGCAGDCLDVGANIAGATEGIGLGFSLKGELMANQTYDAVSSVLGTTPFPGYSTFSATYIYSDVNTCYYEGMYLVRGQVTLTRFDEVARIASGRFACTLYKPGCDTLRVTDGRFDVRF